MSVHQFIRPGAKQAPMLNLAHEIVTAEFGERPPTPGRIDIPDGYYILDDRKFHARLDAANACRGWDWRLKACLRALATGSDRDDALDAAKMVRVLPAILPMIDEAAVAALREQGVRAGCS